MSLILSPLYTLLKRELGSREGVQVSKDSLIQAIRRAGQKAGLREPVTFSSLRRTFFTRMAEKLDLVTLSYLMGQSLKTTLHFANTFNLKPSTPYLQFHPVNPSGVNTL